MVAVQAAEAEARQPQHQQQKHQEEEEAAEEEVAVDLPQFQFLFRSLPVGAVVANMRSTSKTPVQRRCAKLCSNCNWLPG